MFFYLKINMRFFTYIGTLKLILMTTQKKNYFEYYGFQCKLYTYLYKVSIYNLQRMYYLLATTHSWHAA